MKRNLNVMWGLLLIGGGVLFLLQNLGYLNRVSGYLWALGLGALGLGFLASYFMERDRWWAIIPGVVLLSLAALVGLQAWNSELVGPWSGPLVLGGVALAFWLVYLARRAFWWAIIPAGVLTTLAVVARIDNAGGPSTGAVFFFGLAATFIVVLLATRMSWAIWPAAGLALVAVFILVGQSRFINYLWPVLLIAAGLFILFRVWRPANR
jgi:hypothetical protein